MIGFIRGTVIESNAVDGEVIVEAGQSGVGYALSMTERDAGSLLAGDEVSLYVSTRVSQDDVRLYGFKNRDERVVFQKLTDISGIGPSVALAMINVYSPSEIQMIGINRDEAALTKVSGIGKKKAAAWITSIGQKLESCLFSGGATQTQIREAVKASPAAHTDTREALAGLGYNDNAIDNVLHLLDQSGETLPLVEEIRWCIQHM